MSNHEVIVTEVHSDGTTFTYEWTQFDPTASACLFARAASKAEYVAAMVVAQGQDGAVCYINGENVSLSEVVRVQNALI